MITNGQERKCCKSDEARFYLISFMVFILYCGMTISSQLNYYGKNLNFWRYVWYYLMKFFLFVVLCSSISMWMTSYPRMSVNDSVSTFFILLVTFLIHSGIMKPVYNAVIILRVLYFFSLMFGPCIISGS